MELVLHSPHKGSGSIHVSLHHDLAGKAAEGCLDSVVLHIIWVYPSLAVGVIEVHHAVESSSGYGI